MAPQSMVLIIMTSMDLKYDLFKGARYTLEGERLILKK